MTRLLVLIILFAALGCFAEQADSAAADSIVWPSESVRDDYGPKQVKKASSPMVKRIRIGLFAAGIAASGASLYFHSAKDDEYNGYYEDSQAGRMAEGEAHIDQAEEYRGKANIFAVISLLLLGGGFATFAF